MILLSQRAEPQTNIGYILVTGQPTKRIPAGRKLRIHKVVIPNATGGTTECSQFVYPAARLTTDWDKVTCYRCLSKIPRRDLK